MKKLKKLFVSIFVAAMALTCAVGCSVTPPDGNGEEGTTETAKTCTVSVEKNIEEAGEVFGAGKYDKATKVSLTATTNEGYVFDGWYNGAEQKSSDAEYTFYLIRDVLLTAKWEKEVYTVEFDTMVGDDLPSQEVEYGGVAIKPEDPTQEGYVFSHWSVNTESAVAYDFSTPVTGDLLLVANWTEVSYRATFTVDDVLYTTQEGGYGGKITPPTPPTKTGYTFLGWYDGERKWDFEKDVLFGDVLLTAKWEKEKYTVTFDSMGDDEILPQTVEYGGVAIKPEDPTQEGYVFSHWSVNTESTVVYDFSAPVTGNLLLVANWTTAKYTVTFYVEGEVYLTQEVECDGEATKPVAPQKEGHTFTYWSAGKAGASAYNFSSLVQGDLELYANWTANTYVVTFKVDGVNYGAQEVKYGETVKAPAEPTKDGYNFTHWSLKVSGGTRYDFTAPVKGDITLVANWASATASYVVRYYKETVEGNYQISEQGFSGTVGEVVRAEIVEFEHFTYDPTRGITEAVLQPEGAQGYTTLILYYTRNEHTVTFLSLGEEYATLKVKYQGKAIKPEDPKVEGKIFLGWYYGETMWGFESTIVERDIQLTAKFQSVVCKVSVIVEPAEGGTVTGAGEYGYDEVAVLTAKPNEGYKVYGWYVNDARVSIDLEYGFHVNSDVEVKLVLSRKEYQITANANPTAGGTVTGGGTYYYGDKATLTATAKTGYQFTGWNDGNTSATRQITVTGGMTFTANFEKLTYAITVSASPTAGGTVTGGGTYEHGATATLTATAKTGYQFTGWSDGNTSATRTVSVTEAKTYTANFEKLTYAITVSANPTAGGTVTGGGTYDHGATATLTATAKTGYQFTGWSDGNTSATRVVSVTAAKTYTAKFEKLTYTISIERTPTAGGTATGGGVYEYGTTITLKATTNAAYKFLGWYKDGKKVADNANYTFTVEESTTYTAKWEALTATTTTMKALETSGKLKILGRTLYDGNTLVLRNSATGFEIYTTSSYVKMNVYVSGLFGGEYMNLKVWVDGTAKVINLTSNTSTAITLAEGLTAGTQHHIKVAKMNEPLGVGAEHAGNCNIYVQSLTNNYDGEIKSAPAASNLKIEIYGDSITCGYGALGDVNVNPGAFLTEEEDATETFAYKTAMALGADINVVAHQGWAIGQSRWGSAEKPLTLPAIYDKVTDAHDTAWDFSSYTPDIVIVSLGTNDFVNSGSAVPGDAAYNDFVWKYYEFLRNLAAKYPNAKFVLCYGMMDAAGGAMEHAISTWLPMACNGQAGDEYTELVGRVITVDLSGSANVFMGGGGSHPSAAQHTQAATNLQTALRNAGWIA